MATIAVVTLALNEERNIEDCLKSVEWADERIVVDSGSTDRTVEIARSNKASVMMVEWRGYGATKNLALKQVQSDWVLWLDADERVTPELGAEIRELVKKNTPVPVAYDVSRRAYFLGRWMKHSGWYPSRVTRLFRRGSGLFTESRVHEQLQVTGTIGRLGNDLLHFTDPDLHHYFEKFNRYTTLAAEDMRAAGRTSAVMDLILRAPFMFVKMYFLRRGFLDGVQGFILAVVSSAYVFVKYAKLWELRRRPGPL